MAVRYIPNPVGLGQYLVSPQVGELLASRAATAVQYARAIAPFESGTYAASIHAQHAYRGGPRHDRAAVRLVSDVEYAAAVEFGNGRVPPHHTLARTIPFIEAGG